MLVWGFFEKSVEKIHALVKPGSNKCFIWRPIYIHIYISMISSQWSQNTHSLLSKLFFLFENHAVYEIIWKKMYCRAGQVSVDRRAHRHCMLDTWGYKDTHRICNNYCFSTAITVTRTFLNFTLYVHWLSCFTAIYTSKHSLGTLSRALNLPQYQAKLQNAVAWKRHNEYRLLETKHLSLLSFIRRATNISTQ